MVLGAQCSVLGAQCSVLCTVHSAPCTAHQHSAPGTEHPAQLVHLPLNFPAVGLAIAGEAVDDAGVEGDVPFVAIPGVTV